jgi:predicted  nucleic acid-binding Zn-ribbon protein
VKVSRALILYQLQQVDSRLDELRARLAEVEASLTESPALRQARAEVAERERQLRDLQRRQRDLETAIEDLGAKIRELDDKLYSGKVTNPKELDGYYQEQLQLKARQRQLEDQMLEVMLALETAAAELAEARQRLAEVEAQWGEDQDRLQAEREDILRQVEALSAERARVAARADRLDLAVYEQLRQTRSGRAVAVVERGACSGCRVVLPVTDFQKVKSGQGLVRCGTCGRILVIPPA